MKGRTLSILVFVAAAILVVAWHALPSSAAAPQADVITACSPTPTPSSSGSPSPSSTPCASPSATASPSTSSTPTPGPTPVNPTTFSPNVGPTSAPETTPGPDATSVSIPNVPFTQIRQGDLVILPGDTAAVSQSQAEATAQHWVQPFTGTSTTSFTDVTLARVQPLYPNGSPYGGPGTLQWIFTLVGPDSFTRPSGVPNSAASPIPYPYSAHYLLVTIDATTGQEDGMMLT